MFAKAYVLAAQARNWMVQAELAATARGVAATGDTIVLLIGLIF